MTVPDAIHIHEDSEGMRRLYPLTAAADAATDLTAAQAEGDAHRTPHGWTEVHIIREPTVGYADTGLTLTAAASALAPFLTRVRQFTSTASVGFDAHDPYGAYEQDAHCYGTGPDCFIKLEHNGELVTGIWFEAETGDTDNRERMRQALLAIDSLVRSIIADYWLHSTGAISDTAFLDGYMRQLGAVDE